VHTHDVDGGGGVGDLTRLRKRQRHQHRVALGGVFGHRMVDEDAPHHDRGHGEEVTAAFPLRPALAGEAEPGLVRSGVGVWR
jgi:hypothetical protein